MRRRRRSSTRDDRPAPKQPAARKNDEITAPRVLLVGPDGEALGVTPTDAARELAREHDLDLVEVAAHADPPVCRVTDYEKFRYEQEQKQKQARRNQKHVVVKGVRLKAMIGEHDYRWKQRQAHQFLEQGAKVKLSLMLRGREREHTDRARQLLLRFAGEIDDVATIDSQPLLEGRSFTMLLAPRKGGAAIV